MTYLIVTNNKQTGKAEFYSNGYKIGGMFVPEFSHKGSRAISYATKQDADNALAQLPNDLNCRVDYNIFAL